MSPAKNKPLARHALTSDGTPKYRTLLERVDVERIRRGLRSYDIAEELGVTVHSIYNWRYHALVPPALVSKVEHWLAHSAANLPASEKTTKAKVENVRQRLIILWHPTNGTCQIYVAGEAVQPIVCSMSDSVENNTRQLCSYFAEHITDAVAAAVMHEVLRRIKSTFTAWDVDVYPHDVVFHERV